MAFGVKIKRVELSKAYTCDELVAAMKESGEWEMGEPFAVKHGFAWLVAFPPIDRQNQVWVQPCSKEPAQKWQIMLSHDIAGDFGNMAKNALLDAVTDGWASMGSVFGKKAKAGEKQVDDVIEALKSRNL